MTLKQRLQQSEILLAPGVGDALTSLIAEQAEAEALYLCSTIFVDPGLIATVDRFGNVLISQM